MKAKAAAAAAAMAVMLILPATAARAAGSDLTSIAAVPDADGTVTFADGERWYQTDSFENGKEYVIGAEAGDGAEHFLCIGSADTRTPVWKYYRETMVNSRSKWYTSIYNGVYSLISWEGGLSTVFSRRSKAAEYWDYKDGALSYTYDGATEYLSWSGSGYGMTADKSAAAEVRIYTRGEQLGRCIAKQPEAESYVLAGSGYAAPEFSIELKDSEIIADEVVWYVDGEAQESGGMSFLAEQLADNPAGIHRVKCHIEGHDGKNNHYREDSAEALFIIANGVVPDSVLTFSDVHEQYRFIGEAIEEIFAETGGRVPSLVISTGDWVNGTAADRERMMRDHFPLMESYLGGLDTVYVAGNHDSSEAAAEMSIAAGLGADESVSDGCGVVYRGGTGAGTNSKAAKDIVVYGISCAAMDKYTEAGLQYSYDSVCGQLEDFLRQEAKDYHGELIIISAHAGLHTLGIQPESVNRSGARIGEWSGLSPYNIDGAYDMVSLINKYASEYGMNIMYLYGHNHSNGEVEFLLTRGDTIVSTRNYAEKDYGEQPLEFTYGQSGFLSTTIGAADAHYSFIYLDGDHIVYDLNRLSRPASKRHTEIPLRYEPPVTTTTVTAVSTSTQTTASSVTSTTKRSDNRNSPHTGDSRSMIPALAVAAIVMLLSRRRR